MFSQRLPLRRKSKDEAEKPFWISFSDLMTALMVLFLVALSVALLAVTRTVSQQEQDKLEREQEIEKILDQVTKSVKQFPGVFVDRDKRVVDFGEQARFETGSHRLSPEQARLIRSVVPEVLSVARNNLGEKWLNHIVVEGFTDQRGSYLLNLNLSMQRAQRMLCVLLGEQQNASERPYTQEERKQIRDLFVVGGYAFNLAKPTLEESRRIELRLEFYPLYATKESSPAAVQNDYGICPI